MLKKFARNFLGSSVQHHERMPSSESEGDHEILPVLNDVLDNVLQLVEANQRESAVRLLVQVFEMGMCNRPKVVDSKNTGPLAVFVGPVGELCRGKNDELVIRTSGDDPPQWWSKFQVVANDINRAIKKRVPFSGLRGDRKALSDMPVDEAAEVIERMLILATDGRTRLQAALS